MPIEGRLSKECHGGDRQGSGLGPLDSAIDLMVDPASEKPRLDLGERGRDPFPTCPSKIILKNCQNHFKSEISSIHFQILKQKRAWHPCKISDLNQDKTKKVKKKPAVSDKDSRRQLCGFYS
jgi:hypothetical protein